MSAPLPAAGPYTMEVTPSEFSRVARGLREAFSRHLVPIEGGSLASDIQLLEGLGAVPGNVWTRYFSEPAERKTVEKGVLALVRGHVIAKALERIDRVPGLDSALRRLRELRLSPALEPSSASDIYLELETCAQLVEAGAVPRLKEPDIVLRLEDGAEIALACKRPRSLESVRRAFRDATSQIVKSRMHGIVVVSLDNVVPQMTRGPSEAANRLAVRETIADSWRTAIAAEPISWRDPADGPEHHGTCLGALVCASVLSSHPSEVAGHVKLGVMWEGYPHWNSALPSARRRVMKGMFKWLIQELRSGHARITRPAAGPVSGGAA